MLVVPQKAASQSPIIVSAICMTISFLVFIVTISAFCRPHF